jgi:hypothetical protein
MFIGKYQVVWCKICNRLQLCGKKNGLLPVRIFYVGDLSFAYILFNLDVDRFFVKLAGGELATLGLVSQVKCMKWLN